MEETHPHAARIDALGGPTKVAAMLGIVDQPGAVQRVSNWKRRGIPTGVLLEHAWLRHGNVSPPSSSAPAEEAKDEVPESSSRATRDVEAV